MEYKRGDVVFVDLGHENVVGSEQNGVRPVLIVSNNIGNLYSPVVTVACITTSLTKTKLPTHVNCDFGLILCEQLKTIDKTRMTNKLGALNEFEMERVKSALKLSLAI